MKNLIFLFIILVFNTSLASIKILDVRSQNYVGFDKFVNQFTFGDILILGESHAAPGEENLDQKNQVLLIEALVKKHKKVSLGFEFLDFTKQSAIDAYLKKQITEADFILKSNWGQNPFVDYCTQLNLPIQGDGWSYGLNSPKELTSYVGRNGLSSLPNELEVFMPPTFELGNLDYKNRFFNEMSFLTHHGANLDYYFEAQSIWDDTMAWNASQIMESNPDQILVIIVGKFHMMYGGGLPSRLKSRGQKKVITFLQGSSDKHLNPAELLDFLVSEDHGVIADYYL